MSGQSLSLFVFVLAIAFAAHRAEDVSPSSKEASRAIASVSSGKKLVFEEVNPIKHTSKVHGPLDVSIELVGARPENAGDTFVLRGVVKSSQALSNIQFSWRIPEGIEVVNGEIESVIPSLLADQPYNVQVTLKQTAFENAQIHFRAKGAEGALRFADTAQYNSMMQEVLEASRADLKKSTEEEFAQQKAEGTAPHRKNLQFNDEHPNSSFKVIH